LYIAFVPSLIAGFLLHKYWTFRDFGTSLLVLKLVLYTLKRFVFIWTNDHALQWLVDDRGWYTTIAQAFIALLGLGLNYVLLSWIFSL
jgi:putative flippase GtrA